MINKLRRPSGELHHKEILRPAMSLYCFYTLMSICKKVLDFMCKICYAGVSVKELHHEL
jgi:hypothetical protein